ncbi:Rieske (2Fe-2S) protein [Pseudomonas sp. v388]|uniref:Rieske (2Fe-2S) protein n=1 Tax=Pseudomonas sp. v388 TaxID=2479849 RepID=UPI000F79FCF2|nr:Rieske (2Fe-2S) protein [Pseudomonas sp. v388]RRV10536.1 Rieske (2Fe-2S) protein [Pseudomonas sp. v388]
MNGEAIASQTIIAAGKSSDLPEQGRLILDIGKRTIGLFRIDGDVFAYDNVCPHQGGPVCQGRIMPKVLENIDENHKAHGMRYDRNEMHIVCPWHGAEFIIKTGRHATIPEMSLAPIEVEETEGTIYVYV